MNPRVLIVEDSISSALLMESRIQRSAPEIEVHLRKTLKGALAESKIFQLNLVILDLGLPDASPEDVLNAVPQMKPAKVLIITAHDHLRQIAFEKGVDDFMEKVIGENSISLMERVTALLF